MNVRVGVRVTLERANYRELPKSVRLARHHGARDVPFLAVDVANPHAFGRTGDYMSDLALDSSDLPVLEGVLRWMETEFAEEFRSGFIAENPQKLRRIHQYFAAVQGQAPYPPVRCNAPEFSAVIDAKRQVHPCFFITGPSRIGPPVTPASAGAFGDTLNSDAMVRYARQFVPVNVGNALPACARCGGTSTVSK